MRNYIYICMYVCMYMCVCMCVCETLARTVDRLDDGLGQNAVGGGDGEIADVVLPQGRHLDGLLCFCIGRGEILNKYTCVYIHMHHAPSSLIYLIYT